MKIVILTLDHIYANKLVKDLLREFGTDVKMIVLPKYQLKGKNNFQIMAKYIKDSGFYYAFFQLVKFLVFKIFSNIYVAWGNTDSKFYHYKRLARKFGVEDIVVEDINSKEFIQKLKIIKPDLVVSVLFSHLLKDEILKIPKKGVINIHPSYLPKYKGVSPVFWVLVNGEKFTGVTVHFIDGKIDTGPIISRKLIRIDNKDTVNSLYWKCVKAGSSILTKSIKSVVYNSHKTLNVNTFKNEGGEYFSFPTLEAVSTFRKNGKKFFYMKNLLTNKT